MADENAIDQNEVEKLLAGLGSGDKKSSEPAAENSVGKSAENDAENNSHNNAADDIASSESPINQSEIEALLAGKKSGESPTVAQPVAAPIAATADETDTSPIDQSEIESLLNAKPEPKPAPVSAPVPPIAQSPPSLDNDKQSLGKNDIESLLNSTIGSTPPPKPGGGIGIPKGELAEGENPLEEGVPQGDIDYLLKRAEEALESITSPYGSTAPSMPPEVIEFQFPEFGGSVPNSDHATLDQISEVELDIKIELGRTNMYLEDILKLRKGSVVALDKIAGDAVDIFVNGRLIARGEVLVMNDNFCVRVAELLAGAIPIE